MADGKGTQVRLVRIDAWLESGKAPTIRKAFDIVGERLPWHFDAVGAVDLPFASIGPSTTKALKRLGIEPWVEATHRRFSVNRQSSLVNALYCRN